jgi:ATPase subunit of ABC transporter with duplicated ATPase domains
MVISHDRWFLDRIATHILAFEGDSQVTFFDGNYQEYEADKKKRLGEEGAKPKRIRYKPLTTSLLHNESVLRDAFFMSSTRVGTRLPVLSKRQLLPSCPFGLFAEMDRRQINRLCRIGRG